MMPEKRQRRNVVREEYAREFLGKKVSIVWRDVLALVAAGVLPVGFQSQLFEESDVVICTVTDVPKSRKNAFLQF